MSSPTGAVDPILITQFNDQIHVQAQQIRAKFRQYVEIRKMTGDNFAYDGIGHLEARELTGRYNETIFDNMEWTRRKISKRRFSITIPMDKYDLQGMLVDPQGYYAQACVYAMERVFDRVCYDALFATVYTGRDFSVAVSAVTDGVLTVDATGGLTMQKILQLKQNFMDAEIGNDGDLQPEAGTVIGISGEEHTTLMQIDQFINSRYTNQFALEKGVMTRVAGMDLIPFGNSVTQPVLNVTGGVRQNFALARRGLCVGLAQDWEISVKDRPDLVDTKQLQIVGTLGATRTEGPLVQELNTTV